MENSADEIMTLEEVASYLKLQPQTVYKWAQTGQIPAAKLGKEWRFRRKILDEWVDSSIILSKGGFDLTFRRSLSQARDAGISEASIEQLLKEAGH